MLTRLFSGSGSYVCAALVQRVWYVALYRWGSEYLLNDQISFAIRIGPIEGEETCETALQQQSLRKEKV